MMKKTIFLLCSVLLLALCAAALGEEVNYTYGDFTYVLLEDGSAELISYTGPEGEVVIPNTLDGHQVTAVRGNPFSLGEIDAALDYRVSVSKDHPYLATIDGVLFGKTDRKLIYCPPSTEGDYHIPQGIRSVGDYAFCTCGKLTQITIPDSVTQIGKYAFLSCSGLTDMTIPSTVQWIGAGAFADCSRLEEINVLEELFNEEPGVERARSSEGYQSMDGVLYTGSMDGIISYPAGKTDDAFTIPNGVKFLAESAFDGCANLKSLSIPDGVQQIGHFAFYQCAGLTEIVLPDTVTEMGIFVFANCGNLRSVTLSKNLSRIEFSAFMNCGSLAGITIPKGVTAISEMSFSGCASLAKVEIPDSVVYIGGGAFDGCSNLTIAVSRGSYAEEYCKANDLAISYPTFTYQKLDHGAIEITHYDGTDSAVVIPEEIDGYRVSGIGEGVFVDSEFVSSIEIPDTVIQFAGTDDAPKSQNNLVIHLRLDDNFTIKKTEFDAMLSAEDSEWKLAFNTFISQFVSKNKEMKLGQDIDAVSGATITSAAIVRAVNYLMNHLSAYETESEEESFMDPPLVTIDEWGRYVTSYPGYMGGSVTIYATLDEGGDIASIEADITSDFPFGEQCEEQSFLKQFIGKKGNLSVEKDIDTASGATYSSGDVTNAVNQLFDHLSEAVIQFPEESLELNVDKYGRYVVNCKGYGDQWVTVYAAVNGDNLPNYCLVGPFRGCSNDLVIICDLGSYAARYCEENNIPFVIREQDYADDDSWLN